MKRKITFLTLIFTLVIGTLLAQSPQAFNYQGIARDISGNPLANQAIGIRISILYGNPSSNSLSYQETHSLTTNDFGLFNLRIGDGIPSSGSGQFEVIGWGSDMHHVRVEMDISGGANYQLVGVNQLVSVPYALHTETAEFVDDADADSTNELNNSLSLNGTILQLTDAGGTVSTNLNSLINDGDANPSNELQSLTMSGSVISLSHSGGSVNIGSPILIPSGLICMWSGATSSIPLGWVLCNGANGTPDLAGRFIVGTNSGYPVGDTGGVSMVTLSSQQSGIRPHTHSFSANGNTSTAGNHYHNTGILAGNGTAGGIVDKGGNGNSSTYNYLSSTAGDHNHTFSVGGNTSMVSSDNALQAHENRPPYYALAYIMKQ